MASPEPSNSISSRSEQPDTAEAKEIEFKLLYKDCTGVLWRI